MGTNLDLFTKRLYSKDKKVVISTLGTLRHKVTGKSPRSVIDCESFKHIVTFLKLPNHMQLSYTLSLLANCCVHDSYRKIFNETEGVTDLLIVLKSVGSDEIACRAWRLVGNLSSSSELCKALVNGGLPDRMNTYLENMENHGVGTRDMFFRAIRKCWAHKSCRSKLITDEFVLKLKSNLSLKDKATVQITIQLLALLLQQSSSADIEKKDLVQLVELSKTEEYYESCVKCLASIISYHVTSHLIEGSGVTELFISYIQNQSQVDRAILGAFCNLCREGAVRNKVKTANLFPALIKLCCGVNNTILFTIFTQFQYDTESIITLSESKDLIAILMENVTINSAVLLLTLMAQLDQPIPALAQEENLNIFIRSPQCSQLLSRIVSVKKYFKNILLSGRVWAICKAGCPMDEVGSSGYAVGVIEHCLLTGDDKRKKIVSLAVPFLVKPRNFTLLYKLLARHEAMTVILQALAENPPTESTVASIVRLAELFRENHKSEIESSEVNKNHLLFLENWTNESNVPEVSEPLRIQTKGKNVVTFELDDDSCLTVDKDIFCEQSPVINAMLNGHFAESGQNRVKLHDCSRRSLATLVGILEGKLTPNNLELQIHLELISLSDRLLIPGLGESLTKNVPLSGANCAEVYLWARNAGHSENASKIRVRAYWALLSSSEQLMPALSNEKSREPIVSEISSFLTDCLNDLL